MYLTFQWVYNILEGRSEAERVVYRDEDPLTGFVLIPDLKWDTKDLNNLYLVAVVRRRDILSLRDLTAEHIPLLRHIMTSGKVSLSLSLSFPPSLPPPYLLWLTFLRKSS